MQGWSQNVNLLDERNTINFQGCCQKIKDLATPVRADLRAQRGDGQERVVGDRARGPAPGASGAVGGPGTQTGELPRLGHLPGLQGARLPQQRRQAEAQQHSRSLRLCDPSWRLETCWTRVRLWGGPGWANCQKIQIYLLM